MPDSFSHCGFQWNNKIPQHWQIGHLCIQQGKHRGCIPARLPIWPGGELHLYHFNPPTGSTEQMFHQQHSSSDDQSQGDSVFVWGLIIAPLSLRCDDGLHVNSERSASFFNVRLRWEVGKKIAAEVDLISLSDSMWERDPTPQQCGIVMQ